MIREFMESNYDFRVHRPYSIVEKNVVSLCDLRLSFGQVCGYKKNVALS
ncbi:MAG: hypothetical protein ACI956_001254 [Nonlabens sp.]|jgi:hypothetical protein